MGSEYQGWVGEGRELFRGEEKSETEETESRESYNVRNISAGSMTIILFSTIMDVAPFTTDHFATGPFTTRFVVKGSVIIIIIIIMIVIIVFGICVRFFLSISWSGVIMMVVYEEVDSETDMVAD